MNETSRIMFKVGYIINLIIIAVSLVLVVAGTLTLVLDEKIAAEGLRKGITILDNKAEVDILGRVVLIPSAIALVMQTIILLLAIKFKNNIINTSVANNSSYYVALLVVGLFGSIFYILAAIFGLISNSGVNRNHGSM